MAHKFGGVRISYKLCSFTFRHIDYPTSRETHIGYGRHSFCQQRLHELDPVATEISL